jgi:hypothetical protein
MTMITVSSVALVIAITIMVSVLVPSVMMSAIFPIVVISWVGLRKLDSKQPGQKDQEEENKSHDFCFRRAQRDSYSSRVSSTQ